MNIIRINEKKIDPVFLQLMFRNSKFQEYLDNYISGSTNRKYIKTNEMLEFYIPDLDLKKQQIVTDKFLIAQSVIDKNKEIINDLVEDFTKV